MNDTWNGRASSLCMWGWITEPKPLCQKPALTDLDHRVTVFNTGYSCSGPIPVETEGRVSWTLYLCPEHFEEWEKEARKFDEETATLTQS